MKRLFIFFLICGLLLSCFTGCGEQQEVTPTQIEPSAAVSQDSVEEQQEVLSEVEEVATEPDPLSSTSADKEPVVSQAAQSKGEQVSSKVAVSSQPKEEPVSSAVASGSGNPQGGNADLVDQRPTFTNETELKNWLLSGNTYTEERNGLLGTLSSGNTITYYRPKVYKQPEMFTLQCVEAYSRISMVYRYDYTDAPDWPEDTLSLSVYMELSQTKIRDYTRMKQNYDEGKDSYYLSIVNGISYYYSYNSSFGATVIHWQQNGLYHSANLKGHFDKIDQILPLLELEKVTLRTDVVTE